MTPETHAALGRVIAFRDAWAEETDTGDGGEQTIQTARGHGAYPRLTLKDLCILLDAIDPTPTLEWGIRFRFPQVGPTDIAYKSEGQARAALPSSGASAIIHRYAVRRPDDVSEWIEGEPAAQEGDDQ